MKSPSMLTAPENYKGIEFIRISSLPIDQKNQIRKSINQDAIINILKGEALMTDCVQYKHYLIWYENIYVPDKSEKTIPVAPDFAIAS